MVWSVCVCVCGLRENVENVTQKGAQPMDVLSGTTWRNAMPTLKLGH